MVRHASRWRRSINKRLTREWPEVNSCEQRQESLNGPEKERRSKLPAALTFVVARKMTVTQERNPSARELCSSVPVAEYSRGG